MKNKYFILTLIELGWIALTLLLVYIFINPILVKTNDYKYLYENIFFIIAFVTATRHIFLLNYSFLGLNVVTKGIALVLNLFLLVFCYLKSQEMIDYMEYEAFFGITFLPEIKDTPTFRQSFNSYLSGQATFFAITATISILVLNFTLLRSIFLNWIKDNKTL